MKRLIALCAIALVSTLLLAGFAGPKSRDADLQSLRDNEIQWNLDYVNKDAVKLAAHYSDDAVMMASGEPNIVGHKAILAGFKALVLDPALILKITTVKADVADSGDLGYTQGTYVLAYTDPQSKQVVHEHGTYLTVFRKAAEGSWKATNDAVIADPPPPPSK